MFGVPSIIYKFSLKEKKMLFIVKANEYGVVVAKCINPLAKHG
jgi:hypothetical protein